MGQVLTWIIKSLQTTLKRWRIESTGFGARGPDSASRFKTSRQCYMDQEVTSWLSGCFQLNNKETEALNH